MHDRLSRPLWLRPQRCAWLFEAAANVFVCSHDYIGVLRIVMTWKPYQHLIPMSHYARHADYILHSDVQRPALDPDFLASHSWMSSEVML
jgi:hypothetical protein